MLPAKRAAAHAARLCLRAASAAASSPPALPQPEIYGVRLFTNEVRTVLSVLAGVGLFGGIVAAVGYRNDAHVQRLEEKLLNVEASVVKQLDGASNTMRAEVAGVKDAVDKQVAGVSSTMRAEVAGVSSMMRAEVAGVRAEARAAALEVLKDYGVSVAGGKAGAAAQ